MATFKKGESFKNQRVEIASAFPQKGAGMTGMNVALSIANDTKSIEDVKTDPMLTYGTYTDADGNKKNTFTTGYSADQYAKMVEASNKDGDAMVFEADLFPASNGKGLLVNTNSLRTPEQPFDKEAHKANTLAAREAKKAARAAKESGSPEQEKEDALEA